MEDWERLYVGGQGGKGQAALLLRAQVEGKAKTGAVMAQVRRSSQVALMTGKWLVRRIFAFFFSSPALYWPRSLSFFRL